MVLWVLVWTGLSGGSGKTIVQAAQLIAVGCRGSVRKYGPTIKSWVRKHPGYKQFKGVEPPYRALARATQAPARLQGDSLGTASLKYQLPWRPMGPAVVRAAQVVGGCLYLYLFYLLFAHPKANGSLVFIAIAYPIRYAGFVAFVGAVRFCWYQDIWLA